jgi:steroid 5-alpha reductase family enzyme
MFDWNLAGLAFGALLGMAFATWLASLAVRNVGIVDSVWPLFFVAASGVYSYSGGAGTGSARAMVAMLLVIAWAARLCVYLTRRNWDQPEDRRYQAIRARNQPGFELKSLVYIFALQAFLAWIIALPILPAVKSSAPWGWYDTLGGMVFLFGLGFETVADAQMARFRAGPKPPGAVMDRGLWRYSRHPNYFGECVLWWGFYLIALGAQAPFWIVASPLLISFLLLKVSGVPMLEQEMAERRPAYRDYIARTSPFFPRPPKPPAES